MLGALPLFAADAAPNYREGEAIVLFKPATTPAKAQAKSRAAAARHGLTTVREFTGLAARTGHHRCHFRSDKKSTDELIAALSRDPDVALAEPNYLRYPSSIAAPNDPRFTTQWALHNTGTAGADIRFLEAWAMAKPNPAEIVVAVIDSGIDLIHPDLTPNLWVNPGEIPHDNIDNDGNGRIDDVNGYDFSGAVDAYAPPSVDPAPWDGTAHGTHVSGIIAATSNNSLGISGAGSHARIMPLKVIPYGAALDAAAEIAAIEYAVMMKTAHNVNLVAINASFGGSGYSIAERDAIQAAANANIVFCAAAGNESKDNTATPTYPANHRLSNMIVVAASDSTDQLAGFSNYGSTVDLAAPGASIISTIPSNSANAGSVSSVTCGGTTYATLPLQYCLPTTGITGTLHACAYGTNAADFPPAVQGNIALIQRGNNTTFAVKIANARAAGAVAVVIYDNVTASTPFAGKADPTDTWIPALGVTAATGQALLAALPATASVVLGVSDTNAYEFYEGTSMATPFVTAAVAFAARNFPNETAVQRVARIVSHTAPVGALAGKVISGGRLDLVRIVDTDTDGLPDWWETQYFSNLAQAAAADPDSDGFTNLQEFLIATQPNNPASRLAITSTAITTTGSNKNFSVIFPTATGVTYRVERSDTLATWLQLGTNISGTGSPATVTDFNAVNLHPRRFYRVRILSP